MIRNKSGISLIVLVITVIVMIILAGSIIISLSNSGIIGKANEAVDANNLKQVQSLAALAWSEAYIDKMDDNTVDLEQRVIDALDENKVDRNKYVIDVTDNGVNVVAKSTLGELISDPTVDYGKLVDYEANGITEWQVYYEDETNGYVFLVAKNVMSSGDVGETEVTTEINNVYKIFKLGQEGYELNTTQGSKYVASLISKYSSYVNTTASYKDYVVGAIGSPTIELLAAGYNAKHKVKAITPIVDYTYYDDNDCNGAYGYMLNSLGNYWVSVENDELYVLKDSSYNLASPAAESSGGNSGFVLCARSSQVYPDNVTSSYYIRPVVCIKSSVPAIETENGYSLIK